jgi:hypothetical protein
MKLHFPNHKRSEIQAALTVGACWRLACWLRSTQRCSVSTLAIDAGAGRGLPRGQGHFFIKKFN